MTSDEQAACDAKAEAAYEDMRRSDAVDEATASLRADNARLRGLINDVAPKTLVGPGGAVPRDLRTPCPWCNRYPCETTPGGHAKDCPAFTEAGDVR